MKIKYKCRCMDAEREIGMRARHEREDLLFWMGLVMRTISEDHHLASPHCVIEKMTYVKIPADENTGIGMEPKLH